jgi:hypothetical protein
MKIRLAKNIGKNLFSIAIESHDGETVEYWGSFEIDDLKEFVKENVSEIELERVD